MDDTGWMILVDVVFEGRAVSTDRLDFWALERFACWTGRWEDVM